MREREKRSGKRLYKQRVLSNEAHSSTEFIQDHPAAGSRLFSRKLHIAGDFPYSTLKQTMSYFQQYTETNGFNARSAGTITNAEYSNIGNIHDVQEDPQEPRVNTQKIYIPSLFVLAHQCVRISSEKKKKRPIPSFEQGILSYPASTFKDVENDCPMKALEFLISSPLLSPSRRRLDDELDWREKRPQKGFSRVKSS